MEFNANAVNLQYSWDFSEESKDYFNCFFLFFCWETFLKIQQCVHRVSLSTVAQRPSTPFGTWYILWSMPTCLSPSLEILFLLWDYLSEKLRLSKNIPSFHRPHKFYRDCRSDERESDSWCINCLTIFLVTKNTEQKGTLVWDPLP